MVKTTNGLVCESTPCAMHMDRRSEFDATISKPGYKTVVVHVHSKVSAVGGIGFAGNALAGGLVGAGVDVASGATLSLSPNPAHVTLKPVDPASAPIASAADPNP